MRPTSLFFALLSMAILPRTAAAQAIWAAPVSTSFTSPPAFQSAGDTQRLDVEEAIKEYCLTQLPKATGVPLIRGVLLNGDHAMAEAQTQVAGQLICAQVRLRWVVGQWAVISFHDTAPERSR